MVGQWTEQEASALRQALRMTIPEFAERLGVARKRTVIKWEAHGSAIIPVPVMQAVLDTVLARAAKEAKSRFRMLLAANGGGVQAAQPGAEVLAELGGAMLAAPAPVPQRLDPEAIGRLRTILMEYVKIDNLLGPAHLLALMKLHLNFIGELLNVASGQVRTELLTPGRAMRSSRAGCTRTPATRNGPPIGPTAHWAGRGRLTTPDRLICTHAHEQPGIRPRRCEPDAGSGSGGAAQAGPALATCSRPGVRQEARGHALSGDPTACARALAAAQEQATAPEDHREDEGALTGYCTPSYIDGEAADCWMLLEQPRQAVAILEHGLSAWPAPYQRDRGLNLARLAVARAASREPEQACAVAQEAAAIITNTWSARAIAELRRLPALLAPGLIWLRSQSCGRRLPPCPELLQMLRLGRLPRMDGTITTATSRDERSGGHG